MPRSNWNLEMLVFEDWGKSEYPEKNLSEQNFGFINWVDKVNWPRKEIESWGWDWKRLKAEIESWDWKLTEQGWEPTTNSTHMWHRVRESNPGHIRGRRVLSPLRHPSSLLSVYFMVQSYWKLIFVQYYFFKIVVQSQFTDMRNVLDSYIGFLRG